MSRLSPHCSSLGMNLATGPFPARNPFYLSPCFPIILHGLYQTRHKCQKIIFQINKIAFYPHCRVQDWCTLTDKIGGSTSSKEVGSHLAVAIEHKLMRDELNMEESFILAALAQPDLCNTTSSWQPCSFSYSPTKRPDSLSEHLKHFPVWKSINPSSILKTLISLCISSWASYI